MMMECSPGLPHNQAQGQERLESPSGDLSRSEALLVYLASSNIPLLSYGDELS